MLYATDALEADRAELLRICRSLDAASWSAPSGCSGWSVKDLASHVAAVCWVLVDPSVLPDASEVPAEEAQEIYVGARRAMTPSEVVDDYSAVSERAIASLAGFEGVDAEVPLGDLGTYPARVLPTAFCLGHFTHIRPDMFAPRGPLVGPPPVSDELRLVPTLDWIDAALPQQNRAVVDELPGAAEIVVTGTAGRIIRLGEPESPPSATVRSEADSFVRWITHRATWDDLAVEADGDNRDLDDLRRVRVF